MKLFCINKLQGLVPLYSSDYDEKKKLKLGQEYEIEIKQPRNIKFHKKFFALLNIAFENLPESMVNEYPTIDILRQALIIEAGYCDTIITLSGEVTKKAKSISFANMDNVEFEQLYNSIVNIVLKYILVGVDKEELMIEVASNF